MKTIAIIGATGFVGEALVKEALQRDYRVLAIARNTEKLSNLSNPNLSVLSVDINQPEKLAEALKGSDVVISAYNSGWTNPNIYEDNMKGFKNIEKAIKKAGIKRFIFIGGAGSLQIDGKYLVDGADFPKAIKPGALSCKDYFNLLKQDTDLDWTYFSPAILMSPDIKDGRTEKYRTGTNSPVFDSKGESRLSVEDLAVAIMDEVKNKKFIKKQFTAAY